MPYADHFPTNADKSGGQTPPPPHPPTVVVVQPAAALAKVKSDGSTLVFWLIIAALVFGLASPKLRPYLHDWIPRAERVEPKPKDDPAVTGPLFAAVVRDKSKGEAAAFTASAGSLRKDLLALNCGWRDLDIDEPLGAALIADKAVAPLGTPALVISDDSHKVLKAVKCPDKAEGVLAEVKKLREAGK